MRVRSGVAVDLGTVNTLLHVSGRGLVLEEPSVVALQHRTSKVVAVGTAAEALSGRAPEGVDVVWPLRDGVVADVAAATCMLATFLRRAHVRRSVLRPLAVLCVPRCATPWERQAVAAAVEMASPHCAVRVIEEPVASALGAAPPGADRRASLVVDVGGGTTDVAAVVAGMVVRARSIRVGGNAMDAAIGHAVKAELGVSLGQRASERLKVTMGLTGGETGSAEVASVDRVAGNLRAVRIPGDLVAVALEQPVSAIVDAVHEVLAELPPDVADDLADDTIRVAGGGALLLGLAQRIQVATDLKTAAVEDPLRCVVRGAAEVLEGGRQVLGLTAA